MAIPAAWVTLWLLACRARRPLAPRAGPPSWPSIVIRGALAAVFSGVTFFLVMNTLWGRPPATGRNYVVQFAAWVIAWAPGLLALTLDRRGKKKKKKKRPRQGGAEAEGARHDYSKEDLH